MIKRTVFSELIEHLSQKEISLIVGPRQAGKTTVMLLMKDYLEKKGVKTVFLNLDIEADRVFFQSQDSLLAKIRLEIGNEGVVFIDEIQRKENAGLFLKGIFDMNLNYKLVVSGSGSLELKEKIHESLAGRKRMFALSPLSFEEFVNYKTGYKYEGKLANYLALEESKADLLLKEYLKFGGYPRVVLAETWLEKEKIMDEIYNSYVEKDIYYLLGVKKGEEFTNLVRVLAAQIGSLVNVSELSRTLGIAAKTVREYLWYLEKTFIIHKVKPFFKNLRKEITKSPVVYFYDNGMRNYALGQFGNVSFPHDAGFLFQNFIFNILKETVALSPYRINFWRTKDGSEVDFVVNTVTSQIPIETKFQSLKRPEISRSFKNFIKKYEPTKALIVNKKLEKSLTLGKTNVIFLPFYQLKAVLAEMMT